MTVKIDPHQNSELFSLYLEQELEADASLELEAHLETCEICQHELKMLRMTVEWMGQMPKVEASEDFVTNVRRRVRRLRNNRHEDAQSLGFRWSYALIVGIVIVILMLVYLMFQTTLPPTSHQKSTPRPASSQKASTIRPSPPPSLQAVPRQYTPTSAPTTRPLPPLRNP